MLDRWEDWPPLGTVRVTFTSGFSGYCRTHKYWWNDYSPECPECHAPPDPNPPTNLSLRLVDQGEPDA